MKIAVFCLVLAGATATVAPLVLAVPKLISYQGQLHDQNGVPVNGTVGFVFSIYLVPAGGTASWSEAQSLPVSSGIFRVQLGSVTPLPAVLFRETELYLGIRAGADAEMTPRQRISSAPFSLMTEPAVPIGAILAWTKSAPGTPPLPPGWVECNGQTLSDPESPYNGGSIPDLNGAGGTQRFLRGAATSGGTGGSDLHTLTVAEIPAHQHGASVDDPAPSGSGTFAGGGASNRTLQTGFAGGGQPHENRPSYFEVVWIMRVR